MDREKILEMILIKGYSPKQLDSEKEKQMGKEAIDRQPQGGLIDVSGPEFKHFIKMIEQSRQIWHQNNEMNKNNYDRSEILNKFEEENLSPRERAFKKIEREELLKKILKTKQK